jgi:CBS domain containing-hemolysin-like protein
MTIWILITLTLILINWFFVAAEFSLVKVRGTQIDIKLKQWNKAAKHVEKIKEKLDRYLSATQLWITLTSLWLWWVWEEVATEIITKFFDFLSLPLAESTVKWISIPIAFVCITILHIVVGELLPKYIAIGKPLEVALKTWFILRRFYRIFSPFIWLLNKIFLFVARLVWVSANLSEVAHNEEELRMMLVESEEEWYIKSNSHELIQNVFSFDDREVRHIYSPKKHMSAIDIAWTTNEITSYMIREGYSRYPIYEKDFDNVLGILHTKDMMQHFVLWNVTQDVIRRIIRPYHAVPLSQSIESLLHDMQTMHTHIALVQSEHWDIMGMVTMEDIVEELIGDVQDETDTESQPYTLLEDGTWMIQWQAALSMVNDIIPEPLEESDAYTTLAWYLIHLRGRIPVKWEKLEDAMYQYRIENMRKHSIQSVHMAVKNESIS